MGLPGPLRGHAIPERVLVMLGISHLAGMTFRKSYPSDVSDEEWAFVAP
jgi:hypothetical protein